MTNIWQKLPKPFFALAPMEEVTDTVFRQIVVLAAGADVMFTEFVNVEGLMSKGRKALEQRLKFSSNELPLIAQIWGLIPENFYKAAKYLVRLGFSGIDLNFGCPQKDVIKKGLCIALINNRKLASEIIQATKEGAGKLPVSVKTRIGLNEIITEDWIGFLLQHNLTALTIHGRTAKEMSTALVHWDEIARSVKLRDKISPKTLIIGNGDVESIDQGLKFVKQFRVDGIMIGRGIFKNPWVFEKPGKMHTVEERLKLLLKHAEIFEKTWGSSKNWAILNKYFKIYCQGFPKAAELRQKLVGINRVDEIKLLIKDYLDQKIFS